MCTYVLCTYVNVHTFDFSGNGHIRRPGSAQIREFVQTQQQVLSNPVDVLRENVERVIFVCTRNSEVFHNKDVSWKRSTLIGCLPYEIPVFYR